MARRCAYSPGDDNSPTISSFVTMPRQRQQQELDQVLAELHPADRLDADGFVALLMRAGRVYGPALLLDAWYGDKIDAMTLAAVIGDVWSSAEFPERALGRTMWLELFRAAGY